MEHSLPHQETRLPWSPVTAALQRELVSPEGTQEGPEPVQGWAAVQEGAPARAPWTARALIAKHVRNLGAGQGLCLPRFTSPSQELSAQ